MLRDCKDAYLQEIESTPLETKGYVQADALRAPNRTSEYIASR